jgi:hypothetical protein
MPSVYGWYASGSNTTVAVMPDPRAPCIVCSRLLEGETLVGDVHMAYDPRTYFFRVHKKCAEMVEKSQLDKLVQELILLDQVALENVQRPTLMN